MLGKVCCGIPVQSPAQHEFRWRSQHVGGRLFRISIQRETRRTDWQELKPQSVAAVVTMLGKREVSEMVSGAARTFRQSAS